MPYRTILIDDVSMNLLIDKEGNETITINDLTFLETGAQTIDGELRYYYAVVHSVLLLIVTRHGLRLSKYLAPGACVTALIGWDDGDNPYTMPAHRGRKHSKITIIAQASNEPEAVPLSAVIARAPRLGQRGGNRPGSGRPALTGERMDSYDVTLPTGMATWLSGLAGGNLSAGVREAAHRAGYTPQDPEP